MKSLHTAHSTLHIAGLNDYRSPWPSRGLAVPCLDLEHEASVSTAYTNCVIRSAVESMTLPARLRDCVPL